MKIAILHHHLNRGGVTQVVGNHLRCLASFESRQRATDVAVLHGGRAAGWPDQGQEQGMLPVQVGVVPGLDYESSVELRCDQLATDIAAALRELDFHPAETILHIHNHSLGKNVSLPGALRQLAQRGYRMLLQIHDFAEDLRPANFEMFSRALGTRDGKAVGQYVYPDAEHIHYALLNRRDQQVLWSTGGARDRIHLLPNPVAVSDHLPEHRQALARFRAVHGLDELHRLVLYPVRGIRRKNLGELLLWAAVADPGTTFALTLPATSAAEVPAFNRWQKLARELALPVLFDAGLREELSFHDNLAAADRIITTSVAEGFGLVFLESWLFQRPLIGRNLPEITTDFRSSGINLDHLGESLQVPIEWVGADAFVEQVLALQQSLAVAYGQPMPSDTGDIVRQRVSCGQVDFAALPTKQQTSLLQRVAADAAARATILELNPWMGKSLDGEENDWQSLVAANRNAVRQQFSIETTASKLAGIYSDLLSTDNSTAITSLPHPENILHTFLNVRRLTPVRVEP